MAIKQYKPTSASQRGTSVVDYSVLDRVEPFRPLVESTKRSGGRNNTGRITVRHVGGGARRHYRIIDFKRDKRDISGRVEYIEYDPNRTAFIARIVYKDGERRYILAPDGLKKGDEVLAAATVDVKPGNSMPLKSIPFGTPVHNIEMKVGKGGQLARSAGCSAQLVGRVDGYAQLRMPSGEMRRVREECYATIGVVSNSDHFNVKIGKAGRTRWLGIRPTVRGVAMNPVDHPHGGGEGRTSGGRHPCTPWAVQTKGHKTRHNKRTDKDIIRRRNRK
ncbi:MAG TPA: 50S ribosomal protein L2 [Oligoflexus sp.]|uniref:50S ribosomal protein L2 n=1 Tax=Oligoflexus sp. TaxID=1971216 RepID=UPI002D35F160|nr:50S ribosomal protein L2 [Oligoflexus sp.]HYX39227.1 50S ribosomal protein L2 [Oligoflexus sp.]